MTKQIIGLGGRFGCGKDAVADVLVRRAGYIRLSMAMPLRTECAVRLADHKAPDEAPEDVKLIVNSMDWCPGEVYTKPTPPEIRRLLQWYGMWRRAQDKEYWVRRMLDLLSDLTAPVVISDIRFPNEAEMVRDFGGQLWKVERQQRDCYGNPALDSHESEQFADSYAGWNCTIRNNGTLAELEEKVCAILRCNQELERIQREIAGDLTPGDKMGVTIGELDWRSELARIQE